MSTSVDAEQAWKDLQRIRVPQERVYDEMERCAADGPGAIYAPAALMWVFLVSQGLDLPPWGVWPILAGYVALQSALVVIYNRRNRMRLHRSRYNWRVVATFGVGGVLTGGTVLLTGHLTDSLEPLFASLIQATVSTAVFVLFVGPGNRWATGSLRVHGERTIRAGAGR